MVAVSNIETLNKCQDKGPSLDGNSNLAVVKPALPLPVFPIALLSLFCLFSLEN